MKFTSLISASVLVFATATLAVPHNILSAKDMLLGKRQSMVSRFSSQKIVASEVIECLLMYPGEIDSHLLPKATLRELNMASHQSRILTLGELSMVNEARFYEMYACKAYE